MPKGTAAVGEAAAVVRRGRWLILIAMVAGAGIGLLLLPAETVTKTPTISIATSPYNSNGTLLDLGVSTGPAPGGAELTDRPTIERLQHLTGLDRDQIDGRIQVRGSAESDSILWLQVEDSGDSREDLVLLRAWLKAIESSRVTTIRHRLDAAEAAKRRALVKSRTSDDRKRKERDLDRIATLKATIEPDVFVQRNLHTVTVREGRPRLKNAGIGLIGGGLFALCALFGSALFSGQLRTKQGLISSFRAPPIADLVDSKSSPMRLLSAWIGNDSPAVIVNAMGRSGDELVSKVTDALPNVSFVGTLTGYALVIPPSAVVIVLARPGITTTSDRERFDMELGQSRVERVGLLLA